MVFYAKGPYSTWPSEKSSILQIFSLHLMMRPEKFTKCIKFEVIFIILDTFELEYT
jgi:hypothetical protein